MSKDRNFINTKLTSHYGKLDPLTANKFMEIWRHYDSDDNRFLENKEIDFFLRDFLNSALGKGKGQLTLGDAQQLKGEFLEKYDVNKDGKISISELSVILPPKERFYLLYHLDEHLQKGCDYMKVWKLYDKDLSGTIETNELKEFLRDFIKRGDPDGNVDEPRLDKFTYQIMEVFDANKDGKLQLEELVRLLPKEENFVQLVIDKAQSLEKLYESDVNLLMRRYDKDGSNYLEKNEFALLVRDLLQQQKDGAIPTHDEVHELMTALLKGCDLNEDGKIDSKELTVILLAAANSIRHPERIHSFIEDVPQDAKNVKTPINQQYSSMSDEEIVNVVRIVRKNMMLSSSIPSFKES